MASRPRSMEKRLADDRTLAPSPTRIGRVLARVRAFAATAARHDGETAPPPVVDEPPPLVAEVPLAPEAEDDAIPCPTIDLDRLANPLPAILSADELAQAERRLMQDAAVRHSTISPRGHALIHALLRNLDPDHVIVVDAHEGGATATIARALSRHATGYVIGPPDTDAVARLYPQWPPERRQAVRFYSFDSMAFFMELDRLGIRAGLAFLEGNRDGATARFDLMCAARSLAPGGFIIVNGASQLGPHGAVLDFMARHPNWIDCHEGPVAPYDRTRAFAAPRTRVHGTDLIVLRSPRIGDGPLRPTVLPTAL